MCGRYAAETVGLTAAIFEARYRSNFWLWCSAYYSYSIYQWHHYSAEYKYTIWCTIRTE